MGKATTDIFNAPNIGTRFDGRNLGKRGREEGGRGRGVRAHQEARPRPRREPSYRRPRPRHRRRARAWLPLCQRDRMDRQHVDDDLLVERGRKKYFRRGIWVGG